MMDVKITGGDIALKPCGDYAYIKGIDEAVQRVRIAALTNKGRFIYDRTLGVDYDAFSPEEEQAAGKLDMLIKEAAADIGGVETEVLSYDAQNAVISIKVSYNGESAVTEVDISGNI